MNNKIIQKTIDLSHYKSLYPSVIPYFDENGNCVDTNSETSNYGYAVSDVIIPEDIANNILVQTDINVLIPTEENEKDIYGEYYPIQYKSEKLAKQYAIIAYNSKNKITNFSYYYINDENKLFKGSVNTIVEDYYEECDINKEHIKKKYSVQINEGNELKIASFQTLVLWFRFFRKYYSLLDRIRCDGNAYRLTESDIEYEITAEMQEKFESLGGEQTYNWLKEILFPLYTVCEYNTNYTCSTDNNNECDIDLTYFPNQLTWYDIQYHKEYIYKKEQEIERLRNIGENLKACCLEQDLFDKYGGEENLNKIKAWLDSQKEPSFKDDTTSVGSINLNICITNSIDDLGEESLAVEQWEAGEDYKLCDYVLYGEDAYCKVNEEKGYEYDNCQKYMTFNHNTWENTYSDYIRSNKKIYSRETPKHIGYIEGIDDENEYEKTRIQTESKLKNFLDKKRTYDVLGNDMNGVYIETDNKAQPNEDGEYLDLPYHIYNISDVEQTDEIYMFDNEKKYKLFGNILTSIKFYLKSSTNEIIEEYEINENNWSDNQTHIDKIKELYNIANELPSYSNTTLCDGNVYAEFKYIMGTTIMLSGTTDECHYIWDETNHPYEGVFYTDIKIINRESIIFNTSKSSSYVVYYWKLEPYTTKTVLNTTLNTAIEYDMAECYYYLYNQENESSDNLPMMQVPTTRLEYKLGTSSRQRVESDVFVTRGVSSAFEKYLALGTIQTFEALENYQNSSFNIINSNNG